MSAGPIAAYRDAVSLLERGEYERGATALRTILSAGGLPTNVVPDAQANLGTALSALGRHDDAASALAVALAAAPSVEIWARTLSS